jgi:predicted ester cyclase
MSQQEIETVMRTYLDALLTGGDFGASFAEDVVWTTMETGDEVKGREAVVDLIVNLHRRWFDAAPELGQVVFGDGVAGLEAVFVATHTGEFMGTPPTGARVRLPYAVFYDVADGSITALHAYFPIAALAQQLAAAA